MTEYFDELIKMWENTADAHIEWLKKRNTLSLGELFSYVQRLSRESDELFIYEVWNIVSQLTIYSTDIGEDPRYALETLSRGGGDCEDTTILMADMISSSKYAQDWKVQLVYFDSDNPSNPVDVNHVAIMINTGETRTIIESTAKTLDGAFSWNGQTISGWWYDV